MKGEHQVELLCKLLSVSRSGYYAWRTRRPTKRQRDDVQLGEQIDAAHARSRKNYGAPRRERVGRERLGGGGGGL
jgi:putative transposase